MPRTEILTDVPANELDQVVQDFESEGAQVTRTQQADGNLTVTAVFPDNISGDENS